MCLPADQFILFKPVRRDLDNYVAAHSVSKLLSNNTVHITLINLSESTAVVPADHVIGHVDQIVNKDDLIRSCVAMIMIR